jgi:hypothetical protein
VPPPSKVDPHLASLSAQVEHRPTVEQLERLIRALNEKTVDATTLTPGARRAVVAFLADRREPSTTTKEGRTKPGRILTREFLARLLKVSVQTITNDLTKIRRSAGARLMKTWGPEAAVGFLEKLALDCVREAKELGDPAMAWMIGSSFVKQLKELGAFGTQGQQEGFRVTFEGVGGQLAQLTRKLEDAFTPALTGERVVDADARVLPLPEKLEGVSPPRETNEGEGVSLPSGGTTGDEDLPAIAASGEPLEGLDVDE